MTNESVTDVKAKKGSNVNLTSVLKRFSSKHSRRYFFSCNLRNVWIQRGWWEKGVRRSKEKMREWKREEASRRRKTHVEKSIQNVFTCAKALVDISVAGEREREYFGEVRAPHKGSRKCFPTVNAIAWTSLWFMLRLIKAPVFSFAVSRSPFFP